MTVKEKMAMDRAKSQFEKVLIPMLVKSYGNGVIDFHLRIDSPTHFYVHPQNVSGKTVDIRWGTEGVSYSHDFNDEELKNAD